MLGLEAVKLDDTEARQQAQRSFAPDRSRILGLHGSAVLSRYPIRRPRVKRLPLCYDWYGKE